MSINITLQKRWIATHIRCWQPDVFNPRRTVSLSSCGLWSDVRIHSKSLATQANTLREKGNERKITFLVAHFVTSSYLFVENTKTNTHTHTHTHTHTQIYVYFLKKENGKRRTKNALPYNFVVWFYLLAKAPALKFCLAKWWRFLI